MGKEINGRTISEQEFRHLCGEVWAKQVAEFDELYSVRSKITEEYFVLNDVLNHLCQMLNIDEGDKRGTSLSVEEANAASCRKAINEIVQRNAVQPFDHNKILDKLLNEVS